MHREYNLFKINGGQFLLMEINNITKLISSSLTRVWKDITVRENVVFRNSRYTDSLDYYLLSRSYLKFKLNVDLILLNKHRKILPLVLNQE